MSREKKAGLIPYFFNVDKGAFEYLMMISSNAAFGGPDPVISKGAQDEEDESGNQETALDTAIREAVEELGLKEENLVETPVYLMSKSYRWYDLYVFAAPVKSQEDFGEFHYETAKTVWMTADEFFKSGREDHKVFIDTLEKLLHAT